MTKQTSHPSEWEIKWINDPAHHHHYTGDYHRANVCTAIALRTSLRCLNGTPIKVLSDDYSHVINCREWAPTRRTVHVECDGVEYAIKVVAYPYTHELNRTFEEVVADDSSSVCKSAASDPMNIIKDFLLEELGGVVLSQYNDKDGNSDYLHLANNIENTLITYRVDRLH